MIAALVVGLCAMMQAVAPSEPQATKVTVTGAVMAGATTVPNITVRLVGRSPARTILWDSTAITDRSGRFRFEYSGVAPASTEVSIGRMILVAAAVIPLVDVAGLEHWRLHMWTDTAATLVALPKSGATNVDLQLRYDPSGAGYTLLLLLPAIICIFYAIRTIRVLRLPKAGNSLVSSATAAAITWALVISYLAYAAAAEDLQVVTFFHSSVEFPIAALVAAFIGVLVYATYVLTQENYGKVFGDVDGAGSGSAGHHHQPTTVDVAVGERPNRRVDSSKLANMLRTMGSTMLRIRVDTRVVKDPYRDKRERLLLDLGNHITIAPYVAIMAVLVLGKDYQSIRVTVFLAFFTGLWIKPVLAGLSAFGTKLLPTSDSTDSAAQVGAATGAAAGAVAGAAAGAASGGAKGSPGLEGTAVASAHGKQSLDVTSVARTTPTLASGGGSKADVRAQRSAALIDALKSLSP